MAAAWSVESLRAALSFGDGALAKRVPLGTMPPEHLEAFQAKLAALAQDPASFKSPGPGQGEPQPADLASEADRVAALELSTRLPGVSRWKPNLVPRLVSEAQFFGNFFSHVVATAADHFSDEANLRFFYSDDDQNAEDTDALLAHHEPSGADADGQQPSDVADPPALPPKPAHLTPPPRPEKPAHLLPAQDANEPEAQLEDAGAEPQQTQETQQPPAARFSPERLPEGARASAELTEQFLAKNVLFFVGKSDNSNVVVYDAKLQAGSAALDPATPVRPYWILYARSPVVEEDLTIIERNTAYGSTCSAAGGDGEYVVALSALPDRKIRVWVDADGALHAVTQVDGEEDELLSVWVKTTSNWLGVPSVEYIDLQGATRKERIVKK